MFISVLEVGTLDVYSSAGIAPERLSFTTAAVYPQRSLADFVSLIYIGLYCTSYFIIHLI